MLWYLCCMSFYHQSHLDSVDLPDFVPESPHHQHRHMVVSSSCWILARPKSATCTRQKKPHHALRWTFRIYLPSTCTHACPSWIKDFILIVGFRRQFLVLQIIQLSELTVQKRIEDLSGSSNWRDKSTLVLRTIRWLVPASVGSHQSPSWTWVFKFAN